MLCARRPRACPSERSILQPYNAHCKVVEWSLVERRRPAPVKLWKIPFAFDLFPYVFPLHNFGMEGAKFKGKHKEMLMFLSTFGSILPGGIPRRSVHSATLQ